MRKIGLDLLEKYNKAIPRYTSYPTAVEWTNSFGEKDYRESLSRFMSFCKGANEKEAYGGDFSLYFHIPFCAERCYYCGCHVIIDKNRYYVSKYIDYLAKELELFSKAFPIKRRVNQLHLGGGTPTFLNPLELEKLHSIIEGYFDINEKGELAIEIDPCVTSKEQLKILRDIGFNRLSMGVQDFDPRVQKAVNRKQSYKQTQELVSYAKSLGYHSINLDFIYGLPHQSVSSFEKTIDRLISLDVDRIALFSYAKVPWLKPHQKKILDKDIPSTRDKFSIFLMSREKLLGAGYVSIGMDHFAKSSDELAISLNNKSLYRNFMGYTVESASNYLGFGVSSIGYMGGSYVQNVKTLREYYELIDAGLLPIMRGIDLNNDDLIRKWVIDSVMCQFEIDYSLFEDKFGKSFRRYFSFELALLEDFISDGFLSLYEDRLVVSSLGSLFVRNIASVFDVYLKSKEEKRFSKAI